MDKIISLTSDCVTKNLFHQTKHAKIYGKLGNPKYCDIMLTSLKCPTSCAISCSLECPRVTLFKVFFAEKKSSEFNGFEAKLLSPSLPKEKRGTGIVSNHLLLCTHSLNQIYWDCPRLDMHIMVTYPSGVVHWPSNRVSHLADTILSKHQAVSLQIQSLVIRPSRAARGPNNRNS